MTRGERILRIRESILQMPDEAWVAAGDDAYSFLVANGDGWRAIIFTIDCELMSESEMAALSRDLRAAFRSRILPFRMEVWVDGLGEVLSFSSDYTDIRVTSMRRGAWESDIFLLPIRAGPHAPTIH